MFKLKLQAKSDNIPTVGKYFMIGREGYKITYMNNKGIYVSWVNGNGVIEGSSLNGDGISHDVFTKYVQQGYYEFITEDQLPEIDRSLINFKLYDHVQT